VKLGNYEMIETVDGNNETQVVGGKIENKFAVYR